MASRTLHLTPGPGINQSILEIDTNHGEELFLLFSPDTTNGPSIVRTGTSSPWMFHPIRRMGSRTSDPDLQRFGTWEVDEDTRQGDLGRIERRIEGLKQRRRTLRDPEKALLEDLEELRKDIKAAQSYLARFEKMYGDRFEIIAVQGFGDLTMNLWNIGYVDKTWTGKPEIFHLFDEPFGQREYTCLVKWKTGKEPVAGQRYEVKKVQLDRFLFNRCKDDPRVVMADGAGIADRIEFAIYGQRMVQPGTTTGGRVTDLLEVVHQFSDIRHVFQLVNLNPRDRFTALPDDIGRPRIYFGKPQQNDIWFGEDQLLQSRNLRMAALRGSIELKLENSGVSPEVVREALEAAGYREIGRSQRPLTRADLDRRVSNGIDESEWRFAPDDPDRIEILLKECVYPCTMIGVKPEGKLLLLAWKGNYAQRPGWTLREAASHLVDHGATAAILGDEGNDVFQWKRTGDGLDGKRLEKTMNPGRGQMRAVLVAARRRAG